MYSLVETLQAGLANIQDNGWSQGGGSSFEDHCATTAMHRFDYKNGSIALRAVIEEQYPAFQPQPYMGQDSNGLVATLHFVWAWNDTPGRTKAEVIKVYEKAIARSLEEL